jgi:hypothetical protein
VKDEGEVVVMETMVLTELHIQTPMQTVCTLLMGLENCKCLRPSLTGATIHLVEKAPARVPDTRIKELLAT